LNLQKKSCAIKQYSLFLNINITQKRQYSRNHIKDYGAFDSNIDHPMPKINKSTKGEEKRAS